MAFIRVYLLYRGVSHILCFLLSFTIFIQDTKFIGKCKNVICQKYHLHRALYAMNLFRIITVVLRFAMNNVIISDLDYVIFLSKKKSTVAMRHIGFCANLIFHPIRKIPTNLHQLYFFPNTIRPCDL